MAKLSSWIPHVEAFVDLSRPSTQQEESITAIAELVKSDVLTIQALVREIEMYLTTTDNVIRARGILLLAELLTRLVSKRLDNATIHSLIGFFTARLVDWQALRGALIGCLALIRRRSNVGVVLESDARALIKFFLENLQVQSLALHDRKLCFEVLECLLDRHADAIAPLADDLVYGICEAIDEEKDPRCLILTFHLVELLVGLFPEPFGPVASFAGDLFEILGRYFPIYFTHPENNTIDIKRDDLSKALMHAFGSTPFFESYAIPLLLEKLSSSLPLAKLDSLKYLSHCLLQYGADGMKKHANAIWSSLKDTILTSSPQEVFSSVGAVEGRESQENEVRKEAVICLQKLVTQLDRSADASFLNLIVKDEDLEMIFKSVTSVKNDKEIPVESIQKLNALGTILSVSAKVCTACCDRLFQNFFVRLMVMLGVSSSSSPDCILKNSSGISRRLNFGALYLCVELLDACKDVAVNLEEVDPHSSPAENMWFCMVQNFLGPLTSTFGSTLATAGNGNAGEANIYCGVKGLQILATFPCFTQSSKTVYQNILMTFISIITSRSHENFLWNLALKALVHLGTFVEKSRDNEKGVSYMDVVVEKIISLLVLDDSDVPLPLKLEAISEIGSAGMSFMLKVTPGLEEAISSYFIKASVEGVSCSEDVLIHMLECYSTRLLPWFQKNGGFEEVATHFALSIWDQMETLTFRVGTHGQVKEGFLDITMTAMRVAVGGCTPGNQGLVVQKAYSALQSSTFFQSTGIISSTSFSLEDLELTQNLIPLSRRDEWIISLFASVLTSLKPQTPLPDVRLIVKLFMTVLLKGHIPVAQALGSMLNKWSLKVNASEKSSSCTCTLEEVLDIIFEKCLCRVLDPAHWGKCNGFIQVHALVGLGWIGKGLLMQRHEKVKVVSMLLMKCLLADTHGSCNGEVSDLVKRSAADAYHILLSDSEVCLNRKFHAIIKPLHKQHFFSSMMPVLLSSIKESDSTNTRPLLYRAFGNIISETPLIALINEAKKLLPALLDCLSILSVDIVNKDLTYSLLLVLSGILVDENGKESIVDNANTIIVLLIRLISYPHMMLVRETAIQCLVPMSGLPYVKIYRLRLQVLQAMSKALDDRKRPVRQEAVRCRQAWASIAPGSLHY